ncbi:hypothetical protein PHYBLDRAFT_61924 [Phycomyces blakesleeanus NRRL 1555(-)]|uniref:Reverse transcriptase domain-containing protein n=1 Tax=Phycomyces blakesleeanus (strain ATCC 8743b / DSM 1359 / FGSC 10004 / NBRC 33097 / NRRL 1555) TaxID=763407 RepID=A0A167R5B2_PHYB8|nr:hypothetical protein PHYBLDRAFT_61924 [Phycomyces blakesleeanus NRRL 1555(-)]OAD80879.1 hypothetical protein PHYBLDRAFT_61924 [Phycomyces blakesleeanus NRRL 1555(-)]|eukprot:XP_018298919.1 hypothetical protein PHYBLDRAFT_61924 [Phycomyces blakesleeanus NRRL 1555(-)]
MAHMVIEHAQHTSDISINLILNQEKAYNYVYPEYLRLVLQKFRFSDTIVHCISQLFFSTNILINVNGFGLPIDNHTDQSPLLPLKYLTYANDILIFFKTSSDLDTLHRHLKTYFRASNAQIKMHKAQALYLSDNILKIVKIIISYCQNLQAICPQTQTKQSTLSYLIAKLFWVLDNATAELTHFFWRATLPPNDYPELLLPVNLLIIDCKPFVGALQTGCKHLSDFATNRFWEACRDHTQSPLVPLPLQAKQ